MQNDAQMMKGILEGCVLAVLGRGRTYGYNAVEVLNGFGFVVNEATVYPILLRLKAQGFLSVEKELSPLGPMRKYYSLTESGRLALEGFKESWAALSGKVRRTLEDRRDD